MPIIFFSGLVNFNKNFTPNGGLQVKNDSSTSSDNFLDNPPANNSQQNPAHKLQESKSEYRALFENSRDALLLLTEDELIECNSRALETFGFDSRKQLLKHSPWELSPPAQPDNKNSHKAAKKHIKKAFAAGEEHFQWKHERADGTEFWADVKLSRINLENSRVLLANIRDITNQKKTREKLEKQTQTLQAVIDAIPDAGFVLDRQGNYDRVMTKNEDLLAAPPDELLGSNFTEILPKDAADKCLEAIEKCLKNGTIQNVEYSLEVPAGKIHFQARLAPLAEDTVVFIGRDVTAQKKKELQLKAANQQLKAQNQQLDAYNQQLQATEQQLRAEIDERQQIQDKLAELIDCFISLGEHPYKNIDRLVETAGKILDADSAAYNKLVKNKNKFRNVSGWNVGEEIYFDDSAENHVCIEVINKQDSHPVYIKDLEQTRFCRSDPNLKKFDYSTFLGIPVRVNDKTVGSFCLTTREEREFTADDLEIMQMLGRAVAREEKRIASQKELSRYVDLKRELETTLEEKEILLKEVHHRVKNNMQQIISILSMQQQKIKDEKATLTLQKSQTRVQTMGLIHNLLYKSDNLTEISLGDYLEELAHQLIDAYSVDSNNVKFNLKLEDNIYLDVDIALACGLVVNELISNALCHGLNNGEQTGKLNAELKPVNEDSLKLTISDSGPGFPSRGEFENPDSLGLQLVRGIATRELQGEIKLIQDELTRIEIIFPY